MENQIVERTEETEDWDSFTLAQPSAKSVYILEGRSGVRINLSNGSRREFIFGPHSLTRITGYDSEEVREWEEVVTNLAEGPNSSLYNLEKAVNDFLKSGGKTEQIAVCLYDGPAGGPAYGERNHYVGLYFKPGKGVPGIGDMIGFKFKLSRDPIGIFIDAGQQEIITYVRREQ